MTAEVFRCWAEIDIAALRRNAEAVRQRIGSADLLAFLATRLESTRTLLMICYRQAEMKINRHPFLQIRSELLGREDAPQELMLRCARDTQVTHLFLHGP